MAASECHINSLSEKSDTLFGELPCKIRQKQKIKKNRDSLEKADCRAEAEKVQDKPRSSCDKKYGEAQRILESCQGTQVPD